MDHSLLRTAWLRSFESCGLANNPPLRVAEQVFDLQLFAGEKTEPATEKRRQEATQKGNIPKSQDLAAVIALMAAFIMLRYFGAGMFGTFRNFMHHVLSQAIATQLTLPTAVLLTEQSLLVALKCLAPFLFAIAAASIAVNIYQVGWLFRFDPLMPDLSRLNPISGLMNIVSWKAVGELVKSVLKILIVSYIPYATLRDQMPFLIRFISLDPIPAYILMGDILFRMGMKILIVLLVLAIADYYFQRWRHEEDMKMSKEEVKDEYKQREGDPKVKAKIRERQRRLATRRMMEEVPKATVVVTNPTHLAIAIHYDMVAGGGAPKVVAKGAGLIARKIKDIARENQIPTIENKPLARALFDAVEIGDEIPSELYEAVAAILAQVYNLRGHAASA